MQTNAFVASDEIVFATHLQTRITLQTNIFIASDERALYWGRTLLALETNAFELEMNSSAAGDERVQNARSSVSDTHTIALKLVFKAM